MLVKNKQSTLRYTLNKFGRAPLERSGYDGGQFDGHHWGRDHIAHAWFRGHGHRRRQQDYRFQLPPSTKADHTFTLTLKKPDGSAYTTTTFAGSVVENNVFVYPGIGATTKPSPHDTADITVGQALSMQSAFDAAIDAGITASISVSDASGGTPTISSSSVSGANFLYSFVVGNDADHSATITFTMGATSNTYSWSAAGLLTAANDIYTFPNLFAYDGTANGYPTGKHLKVDTSSNLLLTFAGGDHLHSDVYSSQVSSITYKTGSGGTPVTVPSS